MIEAMLIPIITGLATNYLHDGTKVLLKKLKTLNSDQLVNVYTELSKEVSIDNNYVDQLKEAYRKEKLVLAIGAGVSIPYSLPDWNMLLQELQLETLMDRTDLDKQTCEVLSELYTKIFSPSALISARGISTYYKNKEDKHMFSKKIRESLYKNIKVDNDSQTVKEIVRYCIAPGKSPNINCVISYNYDDILENAIERSGIEVPFKSIYTVGMNIQNGELPIYHVHGFLPRTGELTKDHCIVLSEDSYHNQYSDIYSWNNIVQINKFREQNCIFIGTSFTDPNLRRLLDIAMQQRGIDERPHYLIKKRFDYEEFKRNIESIIEKSPEEYGEASLVNLESLINSSMKIMEILEEQDAHSFGVNIIWINDFNEIPEILRRIRI